MMDGGNVIGLVVATVVVGGFVTFVRGLLHAYEAGEPAQRRRGAFAKALQTRRHAVFMLIGLLVLAVGSYAFMCSRDFTLVVLDDSATVIPAVR